MIRRTLILAAAASTLLAGSALAAKAGAIDISGAWSRPAPAGGNGVGYVVLANGGKADRLLAASTPVAGRVEIHESMVMGGKAMMHPRPRGVDLPAGKTVALKPEGFHLMLIKLNRPLKVGESVAVTLKFEKAGSVTVPFKVQATAGAAPAMDHSHH
ncbi:MAG: copper chaperone PCu(A)C [Caulobacteraceae bacterium]|nr:MAG: copper chaperone PCu(A)C [Caulobacteraceae bacterium]